MPKQPIDYSKTVIYKIEHNENKELVYVGSTTDFKSRKLGHKKRCNNPNETAHNSKIYQMIRDNGGFDKFQMLEIKKFPCLDGNECRAEEERCRIELKANMNTYKAFQTPENLLEQKREYTKKYRIENADEIKEYEKQYRIDNIEKIREQYKIYNSKRINQHYICECGGKYSDKHKSVHFNSNKHLKFIG